MASSTTMPMAMVSASSVKLLIEKPRKYMMANVATIDAGSRGGDDRRPQVPQEHEK